MVEFSEHYKAIFNAVVYGTNFFAGVFSSLDDGEIVDF